jgi:FlaA1/EpsC-like NDP-sugar epimerase
MVLRMAPDLIVVSRRQTRKRVLLVGAGRSGRRLVRELREAADTRVVGFLDDNPSVRRRRVLDVKVLGALDEADALIVVARPDEVLVTIPDIAPDRLNPVVRACAAAGIPCRLVRSRTEISQPALAKIPAE